MNSQSEFTQFYIASGILQRLASCLSDWLPLRLLSDGAILLVLQLERVVNLRSGADEVLMWVLFRFPLKDLIFWPEKTDDDQQKHSEQDGGRNRRSVGEEGERNWLVIALGKQSKFRLSQGSQSTHKSEPCEATLTASDRSDLAARTAAIPRTRTVARRSFVGSSSHRRSGRTVGRRSGDSDAR